MSPSEAEEYLRSVDYIPGVHSTADRPAHQVPLIKQACRVLVESGESHRVAEAMTAGLLSAPAQDYKPRQPEDVKGYKPPKTPKASTPEA